MQGAVLGAEAECKCEEAEAGSMQHTSHVSPSVAWTVGSESVVCPTLVMAETDLRLPLCLNIDLHQG